MKHIIAFITLFFIACAPVVGNLRTNDHGPVLRVLRDSSFDDAHFSWLVLKVSNYSNEETTEEVTCTWTTADNRREESFARVTLQPWQYEEVYMSAPITSRFRIQVNCSVD